MSGLFLVLSFIIKFPVLNGNSVEPNQTPRSALKNLHPNYYPIDFAYFVVIFTMGKVKIFDIFKTSDLNKTFCA